MNNKRTLFHYQFNIQKAVAILFQQKCELKKKIENSRKISS